MPLSYEFLYFHHMSIPFRKSWLSVYVEIYVFKQDIDNFKQDRVLKERYQKQL